MRGLVVGGMLGASIALFFYLLLEWMCERLQACSHGGVSAEVSAARREWILRRTDEARRGSPAPLARKHSRIRRQP